MRNVSQDVRHDDIYTSVNLTLAPFHQAIGFYSQIQVIVLVLNRSFSAKPTPR